MASEPTVMALVLAVVVLVVGTLAHADVVELVTGERIEGQGAEATADAVRVEVGGRRLQFERARVRAIYFGAMPDQQTGAAVGRSAREALDALKGLSSVTTAGISYRDYVPRVLDAKVIVDRYLTSPDSQRLPEFTRTIGQSLRYYVLAYSIWEAQLARRTPQELVNDPAVKACPAVLRAMGPPEDAIAHASRLFTRGIPGLWECTGDWLRAADRLLSQRQ